MKPGASRDWIWPLLIAGVALAASGAGIRNQFAQDDVVLIAQNARIHDLANWREILTSPFWPPPYSEDLYRPLAALLFAVEWALGRGSPVVFRIVSYLLYAAAAVGVFGLGRRLLPLPLAIGVALVFAAHPVHVEAVALGAGQNELLVGLLATIAVSWYLLRRRQVDGTLAGRDWILLGVLYFAACLFKEEGLVLPALLVAAELTLLSGSTRDRIRRLAPGYGLLIGVAGLVLLARAAVFPGHVAGTFTADALTGASVGGRALTMLRVVPEWARLMIWPSHLQADYSPQELVASAGFGPVEAVGLLFLLGAAVVAWQARSRAPVVCFGLCWTGIALFPVSNVLVPTGILLAERTLFLPSIGLLLAFAGLVDVILGKRFGNLGSSPLTDHRRVFIGYWSLITLLVLAGVLRSGGRQVIWRNETILRLRSAQDAPRSWRTQLSYGTALFELGQRTPALEAYQRSMVLAPAPLAWRVRNDLAQRYFETEENQRAVEQLRASLEMAPDIEETRHYLVLGYLALGAYSEAGAEADSAIARGFSFQLFSELRALANTAARDRVPPGAIKIRVNRR